jgi:hypothetical protein
MRGVRGLGPGAFFIATCVFACVGDSGTSGGDSDASAPDASGPDASADGFVASQDAGQDAAIGSQDSGSNVDASDASAPACDLAKPFGTPQLVPGGVNSPGNSSSFWMLPDQLTVFIASDRDADGGIATFAFTGTRASASASFTSLAPMPTLNAVAAGYGITPITLTDDGKTIYFGNGITGNYDVWTATRASTTVDFGAPALVASPINQNGGGAGEDFPSWISPDGSTLYFISNRPGSNGRDIWVATRAGGGAFNTPTNLAALNSAGGEESVILTPDELQAFVTEGGCGTTEKIFYSTRASKSAGFSPPAQVMELNSGTCTTAEWVTADGCTLYFEVYAAGDGGGATSHLYTATRGK